MSSCLRSSRSVLSQLLLRRYRPAQPPLTRCYHRTPALLLPASSRPTHLARGWLQKPWKIAAAAFLTYSTVSFLPHATKFALCYAFSQEETVPYTNRVHRIAVSPLDERECGDSVSEDIKKEHGNDILGPSDPTTVRLRRLANDIIRGINCVLLTKTPCGNDDDNIDDSDLVPNGSRNKQRRAATTLPQTEHPRDLNWEIFVVRDERVNAYSKLSGKIVISTGLLNLVETDAEISTILAHEIGHVVARHCLEFHTLAELHIPFLSKILPFSRRNEIEADHIGIMLLAAAGFDPRVALRVYQLQGETTRDSAWEDYINSHPSWKTRSRLLSQAKIMEEALELYRSQVRAKEGSTSEDSYFT